MKISELRNKNKEELIAILEESRQKLAGLRFDLAAGKIKSIKQLRELKKEIARTLTLLKSNFSDKG